MRLLFLALLLTGCAHAEPHHCVEEGWCIERPGDKSGVEDFRG